MTPSIQVIIPTRNQPHPRVISAIQNLTFGGLNILVQKLAKPVLSGGSLKAKYVNAAATRNAAREVLLKHSKASHYLWVDDDVVLPPDTIQHLLFLEAETAGGWYCVKGRTDRWVAGRWGPDGNTFHAHRFPYVVGPDEPDDAPLGCVTVNEITDERRLTPTLSDLAPLGCMLITREILELIEFNPGVDVFNFDGETGNRVYLGDCGAYGEELRKLGEPVKMSHRIVCDHIEHDQ